MAESGRVPPIQRLAAFASIARATKEGGVLIVCRSNTVARQYRHAVKSAGGKVDNLHFIIAGEPR
jgi:hypothetical protein